MPPLSMANRADHNTNRSPGRRCRYHREVSSLCSVDAVTSKGLCQQERGADALVLVFVMEDGKQDAIHRGSVGEDAHRAGSPSDFSKASLDGVCGPDFLALDQGFVLPAGQELVEIVAQAGDGLGVVVLPTVGEAACRGARLGPGLG